MAKQLVFGDEARRALKNGVDAGDLPAYCRVQGTIPQAIQFEQIQGFQLLVCWPCRPIHQKCRSSGLRKSGIK